MQAELREWLPLAPGRLSALRASLPATVRGCLAMRGLSGSVHAPSAFDALALAGLASLAETVTPARLGLLRRGHARPPSGGAGGGQGDATPSARRAQRRARRSRPPARRRSFVLRHFVPRLLGALVRPPRGFAVRA